ncbi:MAG: hypothetical protein OHK0052_02630 [Anaerolineales bacterium]
MSRFLKVFASFSLLALLLTIFLGTRAPSGSVESPTAPARSALGGAATQNNAPTTGGQIFVSEPSIPKSSIAVRDLPAAAPLPQLDREINPRVDASALLNGEILPQDDDTPDPLATAGLNAVRTAPPLLVSFEGANRSQAGGYSPPDTVGDVGPNHYVQMVNVVFTIFDKSGTILAGPTPFNQLFTGSGLTACATYNDGDPVVNYDPLADRWLLSQFLGSPNGVCMAVSQTSDPTGAYWLYFFTVPQFPDYFKIGVWNDAYYMGSNENAYSAYAFDRVNMLNGQPATYVRFTGEDNFIMPADIDGATPPPAGTPGYFYTFKDNSYHGGVDRLEIFAFDVDWVTPGNSSFTLVDTLPMSSFTYTVCGWFSMNCIPQGGTTQRVDPVSEWPMFRLMYRNFGSYAAMVGNFTVDVGSDRAGIRWFELRKSGAAAWSLYQEGTYAPDADTHRWMAGIAIDASGNIALGYNVSNSSMYPALRYTTRLAADPLGTLGSEASIIEGGGSQTNTNRWGDYSGMSVDPADGCTFWFTGEYFQTSGSTWRTRIAAFRLPECGTTFGAADDSFDALEDQTLNNPDFNVLDNDTGVTGFSVVQTSSPAHGSLLLNADGSFIYTPTLNFNGAVYFGYYATDGISTTNVATVTLNVLPVPDAPVLQDAAFTVSESAPNGTLVGSLNVTDPDPDETLAFSILSGDDGGAFAINSSGELSIANSTQIDFETTPAFTLTVQVSDHAALTDTATVRVDVLDTNETPQIVTFAFPSTATEGTAVTLAVTFADDDALPQTHTVTLHWGHGDPQIITLEAGVTAFEVQHAYPDNGSYAFSLALSDGIETVIRTANIQVFNRPPTTSLPAKTTFAAGTIAFEVPVSDAGIADILTVSINWGDGSAVEEVQILAADLPLVLTHTYRPGSYRVTVNVSDDDLGVANPRRFTITIENYTVFLPMVKR